MVSRGHVTASTLLVAALTAVLIPLGALAGSVYGDHLLDFVMGEPHPTVETALGLAILVLAAAGLVAVWSSLYARRRQRSPSRRGRWRAALRWVGTAFLVTGFATVAALAYDGPEDAWYCYQHPALVHLTGSERVEVSGPSVLSPVHIACQVDGVRYVFTEPSRVVWASAVAGLAVWTLVVLWRQPRAATETTLSASAAAAQDGRVRG